MNEILVNNLKNIVGLDEIIFSTETKKSDEVKKIPGYFLSGAVLIMLSLIFYFSLLSPILEGGDFEVIVNNEPVILNVNDPQSLIFPILLVIVPFLWGAFSLFVGVNIFRKKGDYFIGTSSKLIHLADTGVKEVLPWKEFTGDSSVKGNPEDASLLLFLKRKVYIDKVTRESSTQDFIFMGGIPDAFSIEKLCKEYIEKANVDKPTSGDSI